MLFMLLFSGLFHKVSLLLILYCKKTQVGHHFDPLFFPSPTLTGSDMQGKGDYNG